MAEIRQLFSVGNSLGTYRVWDSSWVSEMKGPVLAPASGQLWDPVAKCSLWPCVELQSPERYQKYYLDLKSRQCQSQDQSYRKPRGGFVYCGRRGSGGFLSFPEHIVNRLMFVEIALGYALPKLLHRALETAAASAVEGRRVGFSVWTAEGKSF